MHPCVQECYLACPSVLWNAFSWVCTVPGVLSFRAATCRRFSTSEALSLELSFVHLWGVGLELAPLLLWEFNSRLLFAHDSAACNTQVACIAN